MSNRRTHAMVTLQVLNPVAATRAPEPRKPAPRPADLEGKTIGLIWNGSPGGDIALKRAAEIIQAHVKNVKTTFYSGTRPLRKPLLDQAREECDLFIGATAD